MVITASMTMAKWWDASRPSEILYCTSTIFDEDATFLPDGTLPPDSHLSQDKDIGEISVSTFDLQGHPLLHVLPKEVWLTLLSQVSH